MKRAFRIIIFFFIFLSFFFPLTATSFTVVIDPGHGGKDPGAVGLNSNEKDLNLKIALLLGEKIKANDAATKIVYTRNTDKTVELNERTKIANKSEANLFISIHTNAAKNKAAFGTETYTLGLARTEENLEVAKRENSVILLEDGYQEKYEGFDPNSPESYIMFEYMQDRFLNQSISMASNVQHQFTNYCKRNDRGVRQAGFLVLRNTSMPSILIEIGYITNVEEEKYMNSKAGQESLATGIFKAYMDYKNDYDKKNNLSLENNQSQENAAENNTASSLPDSGDDILFKIQFLTSQTKLSPESPQLNGLNDVCFYIENGVYKYTAGCSSSIEEISLLKKEVNKRYKDAFIVAFRNKNKISLNEALKNKK